LTISVEKETAAKYKAKCAEHGISYSQKLKDAIDEFLSGE
jgi:hypothetical protein